ncbi:MAG: FAD:protein FMN transferase [Pirellulaceae bacterium]
MGRGPLETVCRTVSALGTEVSLTLLHADRQVAEAALDASFAAVELVEQLMSLYRPASQLAQLNRDRVLRDPHPHLRYVLERAHELSERTQGAFDVTVQPLWVLYQNAHLRREIPTSGEIDRVRQSVDYRRVEFTASAIRLHGPGTAVTLNGVGQGFAADLVRATLRQHGIQYALIDTGELNALRARPGKAAWDIGIQHPRLKDAFIWLAELQDRCLATSGDYATTFTEDYRYNHLFDPHTGRSPTELAAVSVAARSALEADMLSTALFVLGLEKGLQLIRETPGADGLFVTKDNRMVVTDRFPVNAS